LTSSLEARKRTLGASHPDTVKTAASLDAIRKERAAPKNATKQ
jgi:hypothetical protein